MSKTLQRLRRVDRGQLESAAYAALRIIAGLMLMCYGLQALLGVFSPKSQPDVWSQKWFGGIVELVTGLLVAIGLFTRPAAFFAAGAMAVAYWQFHFALSKPLPIQNGGTTAVLFCFVFLFIYLRGAGPTSLDGR